MSLMPTPATATQILSLLTILGDVFVIVLLLVTLAEVFGWVKRPRLLSILDRYGLFLLFLTPLSAMSGSLFYSEIAGFVPCTLCWYQRIFMYAQVPVALVALLRRDRGVAWSLLALCLIGIIFSVDQYVGQIRTILLPSLAGTCSDPMTNCNVSQIFKFGYVTIPMMALTAFAMNALMAWRVLRKTSA